MATMSSDSFYTMVDGIARALANSAVFTVFGSPGPIAKLPDALGGDPTQWASLKDSASKGTQPMLALLYAKATFLVLPKKIIDFVRDAAGVHRVEITEAVASDAQADVVEHYVPLRSAEMELPGASEYLAKVGYDLGRVPQAVPVAYNVLGLCYHEMTHALLWLQEFADADVQKLYNDGLAAYHEAKDMNDATLDKRLAFSEAASHYVEDRIMRWCRALSGLDRLMRAPPADPGQVRSTLSTIVAEYDNPRQVFGVVDDVAIKSPPLSDALRAVIDTKFLDGLPLTKSFFETPLGAIHDALLPSHAPANP